MTYSYARLGGRDFCFFRLFGPGLGNLLFPWARFMVATRKYHLTPISPAWPQLKWGTVRRGEKDRRFYFGLFRPPDGQITGVQKLRLLSRLGPVSEDALYATADRQHLDRDSIVIFEGLRTYFEPILEEHQYIKEQLLLMTRQEHQSGTTYDFRDSISVHVRLGDFAPPTDVPIREPQSCTRLSISWYRHIALQIRVVAGSNVPIHIFSDGTDEELAPLLSLPNAERLTFGSSIADLLAMSCSRVLVGSDSTFSRWAFYLGRMPAVVYRGLLRQPLYYENPAAEVECGPDERLPDSFLEQIEFLSWPRRVVRPEVSARGPILAEHDE
jgi:hypothetical protein